MPSIARILWPRRFQVTTNSSLVGGLTRNGVAFTYEEVVRALFGIKLFRVIFQASGTFTSGGGSWSFNDSSVVNQGDTSTGSGTGYPDEKGMVLYNKATVDYLTISDPQKTVAWYRPGETSYFFDGNYYPDFAATRTNIGQPNFRIGLGPAGAISTFIGTILGKPITCQLTGFGFNVASNSFSITAEEYWPFDPGDGGGPIFNATTGNILRGPFPPL